MQTLPYFLKMDNYFYNVLVLLTMIHHVGIGQITTFRRQSRSLTVCQRPTLPSSCGKLVSGRYVVCTVQSSSLLSADLPLPGGGKAVADWQIFTEDKAAVREGRVLTVSVPGSTLGVSYGKIQSGQKFPQNSLLFVTLQ